MKRKSTMMKACVIDDSRGITSSMKAELEKQGIDVTEMWELPEDESELDGFDMLVVDGSGIGNHRHKNGVEFLKAYAPTHKDKLFIHYSGFYTQQTAMELDKLGVICCMKTWNHEAVVKFAIERAADMLSPTT